MRAVIVLALLLVGCVRVEPEITSDGPIGINGGVSFSDVKCEPNADGLMDCKHVPVAESADPVLEKIALPPNTVLLDVGTHDLKWCEETQGKPPCLLFEQKVPLP